MPSVPKSPLEAFEAALQKSAKKLARAAIAEFTEEGEAAQSIVKAGMAVEHLAKSYLASLHPALLAEDRTDFDSLLHFTGHGRLAVRPFDRIRTVGAEVACSRLDKLAAQFTFGDREKRLFAARNAAAHLGVGNAEQAQVAVQTMVSMVAQILDLLDVADLAFWETSTEAARMLRDQSVEAIRVTVEIKIHAAEARFNRRISGVPSEHHPMVVRAMAGEEAPGVVEMESPETCPACGQQGWVLCDLEDTPGEAPEVEVFQVDVDEFYYEGSVLQTAYPTDFICAACGLNLGGSEELEAAGISIDAFPGGSRDVDPDGADLYWHYDPD